MALGPLDDPNASAPPDANGAAWPADQPYAPWLGPMPDASAPSIYSPSGDPTATPTGAPMPGDMPPNSGVVDPWAQPPGPDASTGADLSTFHQLSPHEQYLATTGPVGVDMPNPSPEQDALTRADDFAKMAPQDQNSTIATGDPEKLAQIANANMTPEQLAVIRNNHEQKRIMDESAAALDLSRKNNELMKQHMADQQAAYAHAQQKTAQIEADAARLAQQKPSIGIGQVILGVLGSAIGGAFSHGGPNQALAAFQKGVDIELQNQRDNIANQWKGIDMRKGAVATELEQHGDLYRAQEALRIGTYDQAINDLKTQQQRFDPQGTSALNNAQTIQGIQSMRAKAVQDYSDKLEKQGLEVLKSQREDAAQKEIARHNKAVEQQKAAAAKKAEDQVLTPDQFKQIYGPDAVVPPVPMSMKMYNGDFLGGKAKNAEIGEKQTSAQVTESKNSVSAPVQVGMSDEGAPILKTQKMVQEDGKTTWRPPEKFQEALGAATTVNRLADKLSREIDQWGGQSDLKKSDHWQTMKGDHQALIFALHKAQGIEGFRPGTSELLDHLTGDVDPTSFVRDARAGIQNMKRNINDGLNDAAVAANYSGKPVSFLDTSAPSRPKETEIDKLSKTGTADTVPTFGSDSNADSQYQVRLGAADRPVNDQKFIEDKYGPPSPEMQRALNLQIPPSQLNAITQLHDALNNPAINSRDEKKAAQAKKDVAAARAGLSDIEANAPTARVRDYVSRMLAGSAQESLVGPADDETQTSVSHEEDPRKR